MKIINAGMIALRRTKDRFVGMVSTLAKLATSIRKSLEIHGQTILFISSYIVVVILIALLLFDPNFKTGMLNRLENSREVLNNAIQGALNAMSNSISALARHFGGY